MNVKKKYKKIGNKKEIYIDVKTDKNKYVKSIIYIYIYIYLEKKIGININYVANDVVMRWRNRSSAVINVTLQILVQFDEHNFLWLNLSKILHFLFFKTKRERKYK